MLREWITQPPTGVKRRLNVIEKKLDQAIRTEHARDTAAERT